MKQLLPLLALGIFSCGMGQNKEVENKYDFASFYVRYDEETAMTLAQASFRKGTEVHTLEKGVLLNGEGMIEKTNAMVGKRYEREVRTSQYEGTYRFTFEDYTGKAGNLDVAMKGIDSIKIEKMSISKSSGFKVTWQGSPLLTGESLLLRIECADGNIQEIGLIGPSAVSSVVFRPEQAAALSLGKAKVFAIKKTEIDKFSVDKVKQIVVLEYYANPFEVVVGK